MARQHNSEWNSRRDSSDFPSPRHPWTTEEDHARDAWDDKGVHRPEGLEDLGHFFKEVRLFSFFCCCAPFHVD